MDVNSHNLNINIVVQRHLQYLSMRQRKKNILLSLSTIFVPTPHSITFCIFFKNLFWDPDSKGLILSLFCIQAKIEKIFFKEINKHRHSQNFLFLKIEIKIDWFKCKRPKYLNYNPTKH